MFGKDMNVVQILQIGIIGLGFLLAVLSYHLLTKEQKHDVPRPMIIKAIYGFMFFSVILCVLGMFSQDRQFSIGQKENNVSNPGISTAQTNKGSILYNYFTYSDYDGNINFCNISEFIFSENIIDTDKSYIEGKITGKLTVNNKLIDFQNLTFGFKNKYYLKIIHYKGVAFLEHKRGDYIGYWVGEVDDPEVAAVVCPLVFSPSNKGLSVEEARGKWPILNDSCRPLFSLKEIL